ncbi:hypothetical protein [Wolinella succinogenes]|uniref:hypothetical protein n=1 Tax=Wolinella succinogenes TaxID=844 RepID=UPI002FC91E50
MSAGFGLWVNLLFTFVMFYLAWVDYRTFATPHHRDFKSIIMSTGVLGTFVGIFAGLLEFDTLKIEESVPPLLEGLKVAFYTSIMGMGLAILLSVLQKRRHVKSDTQVATDYFIQQASKLDHLESLPGLFPLLVRQLEQLERIDERQKSQHERLFALLEERLLEVKRSLEATIDQLAKGASEEIIAALERVIADFNQNLSEQFGENFKELNAATLKMITWQENYKSSIEEIEKSLELSRGAMESTSLSMGKILESNQEVRAFYEELGALLKLYRGENEELSAHLESFAGLRGRALEAVEEIHRLFGDSSAQLKILGEEVTSSTKEAQESLTQSSRWLQERIQSDISLAQQHFTEHLGGLSTEFKALVVSLREQLGEGANEVLSLLQKSSQESSAFLLEQEKMAKESTLVLFAKLKERFERLSEAFLTQNKGALEGMALDFRGFWEEYATRWRESSELTQGTLLETNQQVRASFAELSEGVLAQNSAMGEQIKAGFEGMTQGALSGLMILAKALEGGIDGVKKSVSEMNQTLAKETLQTLQNHSQSQLGLLGESTMAIQTRLLELEEGAQKSLKNLALEYVKLLQKITKESVSAPKEASLAIIKEFEVLQKEVISTITSTNQTLLANKREIEGILKILQENVTSSLESTTALNENLVSSLRDLDRSLSSLTGDFKRDYEWFLRRIKELIGSRSGF